MKNGKGKTFDEGYDEFILTCKARNLRPATIQHYDNIVNCCWYKFATYKMPIRDIDEDTIQSFISFCQIKRKQNDVTINTNLRGIRTILYYFMKLGYMKEFKINSIKADKDIIETYSDEELKILLVKPNLKKCSYTTYRNWVIINFLLAEGCRAKTLVNIKRENIDFVNDLIVYKYTKNRKQQIVPMSKSLKLILIEYLQYRPCENEDYLFVNAYGGELTVNQLSHHLNAYNRERGVQKTGVHRYRHTFAKKWILNHGDIFKLQKMLGHSSMDIVRNYVNMFTEDLQVDFDEINPLEQLIIKNTKNHVTIKR